MYSSVSFSSFRNAAPVLVGQRSASLSTSEVSVHRQYIGFCSSVFTSEQVCYRVVRIHIYSLSHVFFKEKLPLVYTRCRLKKKNKPYPNSPLLLKSKYLHSLHRWQELHTSYLWDLMHKLGHKLCCRNGTGGIILDYPVSHATGLRMLNLHILP